MGVNVVYSHLESTYSLMGQIRQLCGSQLGNNMALERQNSLHF